MASDNNFYNIQNSLYTALREQDLSVRLEQLSLIKMQLEEYLLKLEQISTELANRIESQIQLLKQTSEDVSVTTVKYRAVKALQSEGGSLDNLLRQGYIYIDNIRTAVTGQKITYQVATMRNGVLVEGTVSLEEIIENTSLDVETKGNYRNAAKLKITKTPDLVNTPNFSQQTIENVTENASSVFSAVYNYFSGTLGETPKVNKGNAYETYRSILALRGGKNGTPPPVETKEIEAAYAAVKGNNLPFYKGGDIGTVQVKYFGGSAPSLVTTATIKRVIKKTIILLNDIIQESKPNAKIASGFASLFISKEKNVTNKIEEEARNESILEINKIFNTLMRTTDKFI